MPLGHFPTGDYNLFRTVRAIATGDFGSVADTPSARAAVFSILQQLHLGCEAQDTPMRVPFATSLAYAGAPADVESVFTNFFQTMLDIRTRAEQGDLLSATQRFTGMFVMGGGLNPAAQSDGRRLVATLGCGSAELDHFWQNLGTLMSSRAQRPPSG